MSTLKTKVISTVKRQLGPIFPTNKTLAIGDKVIIKAINKPINAIMGIVLLLRMYFEIIILECARQTAEHKRPVIKTAKAIPEEAPKMAALTSEIIAKQTEGIKAESKNFLSKVCSMSAEKGIPPPYFSAKNPKEGNRYANNPRSRTAVALRGDFPKIIKPNITTILIVMPKVIR